MPNSNITTMNDDRPPITETTSLLSLPSPCSSDGPVQLGPTVLSLSNLENYEELHKQQDLKAGLTNDVESQKKLQRLYSFKSSIGRRSVVRPVALLLLACFVSVSFVSLVNSNIRNGGASNANSQPEPFSLKHPVSDLGITGLSRPEETAPPSELFRRLQSSDSEQRGPLPTSAWYQNVLMASGEPSNLNRAYSTPYLVGFAGLIPGLTIHSTFLIPTSRVIQLGNNVMYGLTLGAASGIFEKKQETLSHQYSVSSPTELGVTLHWDVMQMYSTVVRGMAYGTMVYDEHQSNHDNGGILFPTIASRIAFGKLPVADGATQIECDDEANRVRVEREVEIYFGESDFTWLVFFSEPVWVQCSGSKEGSTQAFLQVVDVVDEHAVEPLVIRAALVDSCTNGHVHNYCKESMDEKQKKGYSNLLRRYAAIMPGQDTSMKYQVLPEGNKAKITLDWNAQSMSSTKSTDVNGTRRNEDMQTPLQILHFALPHHMDAMDSIDLPNERYCVATIIGPACAIVGTELTMTETLPDVSFRAKRPIAATFISAIGDALKEDIRYKLPKFFQRGAGDTYFSGKMLAKLGRIALVAEELTETCGKLFPSREYHLACKNTTLPTRQEMEDAIDRLESSVEIWINGSAVTPFVYDGAWGGLVSCGCHFNGKGCDNEVPECPAFSDQGLNFGNAFYNDQHFHYGYHIYAAAVVAHFRPEWGKKYWEQVLLLVRSIANPSRKDNAFPLFRHKDWYQGNSWASGVPRPPYLNGKNQESSSEAIAAYESVALFGQVMEGIWHSTSAKGRTAKQIKEVGQLMTATELRSTSKYWHVRQNSTEERIYPVEYTENVVGILWQTMAQFGTWFGTAEYLPFGIQLLPLTAISEERDELEWMNEMYYPFSKSCAEQFQCTESGWGVFQLAVLATVGYAHEAAKRVPPLPKQAFTNAAGNGNSRTNTLWYIATRPFIDNPIPLVETDIRGADELRPAPVFKLTDCHAPTTCTDFVLDQDADSFTCRERITWLIEAEGKSQWEACAFIAGVEYPKACGLCDPFNEDENARNKASQASDKYAEDAQSHCPPCSDEECYSQLNGCPLFDKTFVCTAGPNAYGCSWQPWDANEDCEACCEMTRCQTLKDHEAKKVTEDGSFFDTLKPVCPPCPKEVCYGELNACPIHTAPYLCLSGDSIGGCSSHPWNVSSKLGTCSECCEITTKC